MRTTALGILFLCGASVGVCQTLVTEPDTLKSLLIEVRQLRQEVEAMALASGAPSATGQAATLQATATKLEGFAPAAGSVAVLGFEDLGGLQGIAVDVRALRDGKGGARGLIVEVTESPYHQERSFIDADEIPGLLNGFDALLNVASNPTDFKNFEVRYTTRGNLQLSASNSRSGEILYSIRAGRFAPARKDGLSAMDMQQLRSVFAGAGQKLTSLPGR